MMRTKKSLLISAVLMLVLFSGISVHAAADTGQGMNSETEANAIWETALAYARSGIPAFEARQKELAGMLGKDDRTIRFTDARIENLAFASDIDSFLLYRYTPSYSPAEQEQAVEIGGIELTEDGWLCDNEPKYLVLQKQEDGIAVSGVLYCELNPDPDQEAFLLTWKNWLSETFPLPHEDPAVSQHSADSCLYTDVSPDQWYSEYVTTVSDAGIMKGVGDGRFAPDAEITLAEVYTIAARLHAFCQTGSMDAADEYERQADRPWYWGYVKYCMDKGIQPGEPGDVTQPALRIECMTILSKAVPEPELAAIRTVADNAIPDLPSQPYGEAVYRLYRAGVLTGTDEKGSFFPDAEVRRCEAAAVVSRLIDPALRCPLPKS